MVSRSLVAVLALLLGTAPVRGDLNLSPSLVELEGDGARSQHLVFQDGTEKQVTYQPPPGWEFSGTADKLTVRPKNNSFSEGIISRQPLAQPYTIEENRMRQLSLQALADVPAESTNVQVISEQKNPVTINHKETFLVTISYSAHGLAYGRSLMFMNRGNEQLRFQFTSLLRDFPPLQCAFLASQFTWQNL